MTHIARVVLANPFNVPKAMPIERWRVGVTRMCSSMMQQQNSATPTHSSQFCGQKRAKPISEAILTTCSAMLM